MGILWTGLRGDLEVRVGVSMVKGVPGPQTHRYGAHSSWGLKAVLGKGP